MKTKLGQEIPDDLAAALKSDAETLAMWDKLRPSCQRGYVRLVTEAKKPQTRQRRIERALQMTADYYRRHFGLPAEWPS